MGRSANLTEWLVWALAAVTGSLDRDGGCTFNPGFLRAIEDAPPGGRGDLGPRPASRPDLPRIVNGELPCAALADEIEAGAVRALIVRMGNPAMAIPDPDRIAAALGSLDVLVAIEAHPSPTTDVATHVLPVADHFERTDLVTGYLQATPFLRRAPAVVEPIGERRPQWWVFAELSRRMGLPLFGSPRRDAELRQGELDDDADRGVDGRATPGARTPRCSPRRTAMRDESVAPGMAGARRACPGRLDLAPPELAAELTGPWHARVASGDGLVLVNRRTPGQYNSLAVRPAPEPEVLVHPDDAAARGLRDGDRARLSTAAGFVRRAGARDGRDRPRCRVVPPRLPGGERQPAHLDRRRRPAQRHADPVRLRRRAVRAALSDERDRVDALGGGAGVGLPDQRSGGGRVSLTQVNERSSGSPRASSSTTRSASA